MEIKQKYKYLQRRPLFLAFTGRKIIERQEIFLVEKPAAIF